MQVRVYQVTESWSRRNSNYWLHIASDCFDLLLFDFPSSCTIWNTIQFLSSDRLPRPKAPITFLEGTTPAQIPTLVPRFWLLSGNHLQRDLQSDSSRIRRVALCQSGIAPSYHILWCTPQLHSKYRTRGCQSEYSSYNCVTWSDPEYSGFSRSDNCRSVFAVITEAHLGNPGLPRCASYLSHSYRHIWRPIRCLWVGNRSARCPWNSETVFNFGERSAISVGCMCCKQRVPSFLRHRYPKRYELGMWIQLFAVLLDTPDRRYPPVRRPCVAYFTE